MYTRRSIIAQSNIFGLDRPSILLNSTWARRYDSGSSISIFSAGYDWWTTESSITFTVNETIISNATVFFSWWNTNAPKTAFCLWWWSHIDRFCLNFCRGHIVIFSHRYTTRMSTSGISSNEVRTWSHISQSCPHWEFNMYTRRSIIAQSNIFGLDRPSILLNSTWARRYDSGSSISIFSAGCDWWTTKSSYYCCMFMTRRSYRRRYDWHRFPCDSWSASGCVESSYYRCVFMTWRSHGQHVIHNQRILWLLHGTFFDSLRSDRVGTFIRYATVMYVPPVIPSIDRMYRTVLSSKARSCSSPRDITDNTRSIGGYRYHSSRLRDDLMSNWW